MLRCRPRRLRGLWGFSETLRRLERFTDEYDFAIRGLHEVRIEAILPLDPRWVYPQCLAGRRAAPPEECGDPQPDVRNSGETSPIVDTLPHSHTLSDGGDAVQHWGCPAKDRRIRSELS